jgi:hypothetical protein
LPQGWFRQGYQWSQKATVVNQKRNRGLKKLLLFQSFMLVKLDFVKALQTSIDKENKLVLSKINEKLSIEKRRIVLKLLMNWQRSLKVTNEIIVSDMNTQ